MKKIGIILIYICNLTLPTPFMKETKIAFQQQTNIYKHITNDKEKGIFKSNPVQR